MKKIYIILGSVLLIMACSTDLDQTPPNLASPDSLQDFQDVLNAAYFYQHASVTPMAVMGDFRADNALMDEEPYPAFDRYNADLLDGALNNQFFRPFYSALYKSILSANTVIENSDDDMDVGEAKFLRALSYFKLTLMFGDVTVNLSDEPSTTDPSILARQPKSEIYSNVIIPDLQDAIMVLDNSRLANGRASKIAAQGLLGKVYMYRNDFGNAETFLATVVDGASSAGISLQENYADIFGFENDLNSEILFATQISGSVPDEYPDSEFWSWYGGLDTKSLMPLDPDLIAAFDESEADGDTDLRREVNIDEDLMASPKYPQETGPDHDWIELRFGDIILLYAEALNENGRTSEAIEQLNKIRSRAGLDFYDGDESQDTIREAIQKERRLELAFEGQRWFDLVRTGNAKAELGFMSDNWLVAPIPISEITSSEGVITQNPGY